MAIEFEEGQEFIKAEKLILLQELYRSAEWLEKKVFFCQQGCSTCCTQSVTISSLEGELICRFLEGGDDLGELLKLITFPGNTPYRPALSANHFARLCLEKRDVCDEWGEWSFVPCVFLKNGLCRIYEVRPFSCRALVSMVDCKSDGAACMPSVLVTLNTIVHQIIEHLSLGGRWGNMLDVLPHVFMERGLVVRSDLSWDVVLHEPEQLPGFLVHENEQSVVRKYLKTIGRVIQKFEAGPIREEVKAIQHYLSRSF